jgi:thioredoxin reductase (NADPH)
LYPEREAVNSVVLKLMFKAFLSFRELMTDEVRNVIIIGSGPAGYTAGLYSARALLEPLMFAGYMSGGQLMLTSDIENFPGYPDGIGGPEMMIQLREQAEKFGLEVQDKNVEKVDFSEQPFKIWVEGELFLTKSVIICTGC